jgi:triacylglycerol esterase/lipase EstA (alpha/beta hydrolase family)
MYLPSVILPGYLAGASDYLDLAKTLNAQGFPTVVVPLQWWEWLPTVGGRSIAPILERLDATVKLALQQHDASQVNIIAHSAGGWVARIYLGEIPYYDRMWHAEAIVASLITLGTPHRSLEPWTRRNLNFVNDNYPGAFHPGVKYVCVAGKSIYGEKTLSRWLAYSSYELTCGVGNTWGDGITPIEAAHLDGAENLTIEGANHSPRSGTWYGSVAVAKQWSPYIKKV